MQESSLDILKKELENLTLKWPSINKDNILEKKVNNYFDVIEQVLCIATFVALLYLCTKFLSGPQTIIVAIYILPFITMFADDYLLDPISKALALRLAGANKSDFDLAQENIKLYDNDRKYILTEISKEESRIKKENNLKKESVLKLEINKLIEQYAQAAIDRNETLSKYNELRALYAEISELSIHTTRYYQNRFNQLNTWLNGINNKDRSSESKESIGEKIIDEDSKQQYHKTTPEESVYQEDKSDSSKIGNLESVENIFSGKRVRNLANRAKRLISKFKIDHVEKAETNKTIGIIGERFALSWERQRLASLNINSTSIIHVALEDDSKGYDIISHEIDGSIRYIEVKSTIDNKNAPFYISDSELKSMRSLKNYYIYRVYNLDLEKEEGLIFIINGESQLNQFFELAPVSFKVRPKS